MQASAPISKDIVLIGGGHSHVAVLRRFGMRPVAGVRLTLIAREVLTPYSGMLPGLVAGHYTPEQAHIDLRRLCRFAGARLYPGAATHLDLERREVACAERPPVPYDLVSIDIGSAPRREGIEGAERYAIAVKPVDRFLERWHQAERAALAAGGDFRVVVVGGGAGGTELCLSLEHRLRGALLAAGGAARARFTLVTDSDRLLPGHAPAVGRWLAGVAAARGVEVLTGTRVSAVGPDTVTTAAGDRLGADLTVVVTEAAPASWLAASGLALDPRGFVRVGATLESVSHPGVFAAGDVAAVEGRALPKSGVYAVRQGRVLAENLRLAVRGARRKTYRPQPRTLALISSGDPSAIASYGRWSLRGRWVWRMKDWIDRRWMRKYQELPQMTPEAGPGGGEPEGTQPGAPAMRCGGCGSKVASAVLRRALGRLEGMVHPDVLVGLAGADDAAVIRIPAGKLLVQSVDHFRTFIDDPYVFGRVTANHCLSDLFAMGAHPQTAQVMISLPYGPEGKVEDELYLTLSGVCAALQDAGAVLVGGHTAEGPELSLGLAVNGLVDEGSITTKGGMQPGDRLVLTKPLGTGVIFAADMRAQAQAGWVQTALDSMLQSNRAAAECLAAYGARACTDVTGFGLAGHLIEMLRASGLDAKLCPPRLPELPGTRALFAAGLRSSLHPANRAFAERVSGAGPEEVPVLYDPQTSGGLLAALPGERTADCLAQLAALGFRAACIGHIEAPAGGPDPTRAGRIRLSGSG